MGSLNLFVFFLAIISIVRSIDDRELFDDNCMVTGVNIVTNLGVIYVTWIPVDLTLCPHAKDYRLSYQVEHAEWVGPLTTLTPDSTIIMIEYGEIFCEKIRFEIQTYSDEVTSLATLDLSYDRDLPTPNVNGVEEVDGKLIVKWDPLWDNSKTDCVVSYSIKYNDQQANITEDNYFEIDSNDLSVCTTSPIEIVASSNGYNSLPNNYLYKRNLPALKLIDSPDQSIIFESVKDAPSNCGEISYKIIQNDSKCLRYSYTVKASTTSEYESEESYVEIQKIPGSVQNLIAKTTETEINLTWEPPTFLKKCDVKYKINYDENSITTHVTNVNLDVNLISCVGYPVGISAIIESEGVPIEGESTSILAYGKIGSVENLNCLLNSNRKVECSWDEPLNSEKCETINYRLNYFDGNAIVSTTTADLSIQLEGIGCESGWVSVQTLQMVGEEIINGEEVETAIEATLDLQ
nr:uncharacterized protein LOC111426755 [Onthophagus taurus]